MTDKQNANPTTGNESSAPNDAVARVTDQEAVRKIIEQYIDKAYLKISEYSGLVYHSAWRGSDWRSEANLPKKTNALLTEWQKLDDTAKDAITEHVRKWSLADIFCRLKMPYAFKILKDAKAYISTDEFPQLLRVAWESDDFEYSGSWDFTHYEILELLESCNMQKFMTGDEWKKFKAVKETNYPIKVYRGFSTIDTSFSQDGDAFVWASSLTDVICSNGKFSNRDENTVDSASSVAEATYCGYERSSEGYEAYVKSEDVLAVVNMGRCTGYIVNPDKLCDVATIWGFADYLELERQKHYDSTDEFHRLRDEFYCLWDGFSFPCDVDRDDLIEKHIDLAEEWSSLWGELESLWKYCRRDELDDFRDKLHELRDKIYEFRDRTLDEGVSVRLGFHERKRFDGYMASNDYMAEIGEEELPFGED